ncbi:hybrid sensor histidine kinase/response regulator [Archangium lipolyticum]|uniref:hybrid sensor histidine kinase/response regulator n=1 Tax=Archangium lipolyticum TaxID=2970465 RepID=UPI002149C472|nr:hybrid sensor histidine kinase/response regulator [Archangium lipolyticum]
MLPSDFQDILACVPQAVIRLGPDLCVEWLEPDFNAKTGMDLKVGDPVLSILEGGRGRDALERSLREGRGHSGYVITAGLKQMRIQARPGRTGAAPGTWLLFEPSGVDDEVAFAQALQEIAREVGETLDVDSVCKAAVLAVVRCAQVRRAEVYLAEEGQPLRRVAVSDLASSGSPEDALEDHADSFEAALVTRQPQIGVQRGYGDSVGSIFAAVPLLSPRRAVGLLVLYKEQGTSFSLRELELWSAAAGQVAVTVENARLLREAQAALRVREEFMSIASHELKTPLTPLKLLLHSMERRLAQGLPVEPASVLKSKRQVDRLAGLVNGLLDVSRLEGGRLTLLPAPLEMGHLVAEVVDQFRHTCERPFTLTVPRERLWVQGDRDRLEQVLVNLLENANKYSPKGDPICVEVEVVHGDARIHVKDRGIGIPAQDQARLFQRFYRAGNASHRHFGGLGLGLFISHSIARLHGGSLSVASAEGQGSIFTLGLPRMPVNEVRRLPRRVLLLDEDRSQEVVAERVLRAGGFEVLTAHDGVDALRRASSLPVDLVLLSSSAPPTQLGLFLAAFAELPRARPIPIVLAGASRPAWAQPEHSLCSRPYREADLLAAVHATLGPSEERGRPEERTSHLERVPQEALMLP